MPAYTLSHAADTATHLNISVFFSAAHCFCGSTALHAPTMLKNYTLQECVWQIPFPWTCTGTNLCVHVQAQSNV